MQPNEYLEATCIQCDASTPDLWLFDHTGEKLESSQNIPEGGEVYPLCATCRRPFLQRELSFEPADPSCILCGDTGMMPGEGDEDDQRCPCTLNWSER